MREGTCWRNQDGQIEGLGFCMWAVFVSDPAGDKTGRKGCWTWTGHTGTKTDLFCDLEVGMLASLLAQERLDEQQVGRCKDHFSHCLAPYDSVHHQHLVQGVWAALAHGADSSTCPQCPPPAKTLPSRHSLSDDHSNQFTTDSGSSVRT